MVILVLLASGPREDLLSTRTKKSKNNLCGYFLFYGGEKLTNRVIYDIFLTWSYEMLLFWFIGKNCSLK